MWIPFTSERSKQSVIVKDDLGTHWILTKGADHKILPALKEPEKVVEDIESAINRIARSGLWVMVLSKRKIEEGEIEKAMEDLQQLESSEWTEEVNDSISKLYESLE